jgi:hypothetical protein
MNEKQVTVTNQTLLPGYLPGSRVGNWVLMKQLGS